LFDAPACSRPDRLTHGGGELVAQQARDHVDGAARVAGTTI